MDRGQKVAARIYYGRPRMALNGAGRIRKPLLFPLSYGGIQTSTRFRYVAVRNHTATSAAPARAGRQLKVALATIRAISPNPLQAATSARCRRFGGRAGC